MDGLKEKILELASQDEDFAKVLGEAEAPEALVEALKGKGLDVTAEELQALVQPEDTGKVKLSDDELEAVAGGSRCYCYDAGGGLSSDGEDRSCGCALVGWGYYEEYGKSHWRCECWAGGIGKSYDS